MYEKRMADGRAYRIQPCIEPGTRHTPGYMRDQIAEAVRTMSTRTRWLRFGTYDPDLSPEALDSLTDLDEKNRVAWCATIGDGESEQGIGIARYTRESVDASVAEFAVTVIDEYKRQGVGSALLAALLVTGAQANLRTLTGYVDSGNAAMLAFCRKFDATFKQGGAGVTVAEVPIPG